MALALVSTSAITSILSSLILIMGSISLWFSPILATRWPTCAAVLSSFLDSIVV